MTRCAQSQIRRACLWTCVPCAQACVKMCAHDMRVDMCPDVCLTELQLAITMQTITIEGHNYTDQRQRTACTYACTHMYTHVIWQVSFASDRHEHVLMP